MELPEPRLRCPTGAETAVTKNSEARADSDRIAKARFRCKEVLPVLELAHAHRDQEEDRDDRGNDNPRPFKEETARAREEER